MQQRRLSIIITALLLSSIAYLCSTLVLPPPTVLAHAYVIGSDPVDGSTIATAPSVVRIFFNATISSVSNAHVYAVQGSDLVDMAAVPSFLSPSSQRELDIPLKTPSSLPQGGYEVRWAAVSNDDGHTTYGLIGFNLVVSGTGLTGTPTLGPSTSNDLRDIHALTTMSVLAILWEWLARVALILWIGILVIEHFILTGSEHTIALVSRIKRQTHSLQWLCLGTLLLGEIVTLVLRSTNLSQATSGAGFNFTSLSQLIINTNYGYFWLIRIAFIGVAMGMLYWNEHRQTPETLPESPQRPTSNRTGPIRITRDFRTNTTGNLTKERLEGEQTASGTLAASGASVPPATLRFIAIGLLLAGLIVLTQVLSDETVQVQQLHISAIVLGWLYRVAQGTWFGGSAYLGYVVLRFLPRVELEHRAETVALLLRRLVPYLLAGVGMVLIGALFFAEASVNNGQQLLSDPYGRTLLAQLLLIAIALLLGLYALFILRSRFTHQALLLPVVNADLPARRTRQSALEGTWERLKQVMNVQTWLAAGILLCASLMSFYAPPIVFPDINYNNTAPSPATPVVPAATPTVTTQTRQVGNLTLALQVLPGHVNATNTVSIRITDSKGAAVTNVQVRLSINMQIMNMGTAQKTINAGHSIYSATFDKSESFTMAGIWIINVAIQRPGLSPVQTSFQVNLT